MRDWLYPGARIVCVDAAEHRDYNPPPHLIIVRSTSLDGLEEGRIYTVRDVCDFYGIVGARLHEIVRARTRRGIEVPYAAARFRPLRERKTDISIFEALLTPSDATEDA